MHWEQREKRAKRYRSRLVRWFLLIASVSLGISEALSAQEGNELPRSETIAPDWAFQVPSNYALQGNDVPSSFHTFTPAGEAWMKGYHEATLDGPPPPHDPLLEKQLGYVPPTKQIEGILLEAQEPPAEFVIPTGSYDTYRSAESAFSYMPGSGQQFGWISFEALPYVARGNRSGLTTGFNMHLLAGPTTNHLPPRLYDFSLGYQNRMSFANRFSVDGAASIGVFSDFEDSARDGIRFPSHLVGMWHFSSTTDIIFGVDYLSRDDVRILPVIGYSWHNPAHSNLRFDMVFPRPRVDMRLNRRNRLYLAGLMGGGTWDIEMPDESNDVFTYRDFRLLFGFEHARAPGNIVAWEFGYIFDRQIDFRESGVETQFEDAFLLRLVSRH